MLRLQCKFAGVTARANKAGEVVGMAEDEELVGLIHLGPRVDDPAPPERLPPGDVVEFLP